MPIDFPTRKLADRATTTPTAPAADDTLQGQTVGGTDRVFLLGNLAGLAPLTIAADQSAYYNGTAWATYSLTALGRSVLAATTQLAAITALGAIPNFDEKTVNGITNFSSLTRFNNGITMGNDQILAVGFGGSGFRGSAAGLTISFGTSGMLFRPNGTTTTTGQLQLTTAGAVLPATNNTQDIGSTALRWTSVFLVNAPNVSSDSRLKTEPRQLRDAEFKAASAIARLPPVWRWIHRVEGDEQNEPEGREARKHFGPTVQAAIAVMEANGLDPFAYSFICYDQWEAEEATYDEDGNELIASRESGDRYSFRKEELLCFLVAAMARQHDELEARVAALEDRT